MAICVASFKPSGPIIRIYAHVIGITLKTKQVSGANIEDSILDAIDSLHQYFSYPFEVDIFFPVLKDLPV